MVFENIFDRFRSKKKLEEGRITIVADHREKNSLVISSLVEKGVGIKFEHLEIGDFLVRNVAIERKTVRDFISSMINKRLITQLQNLQKYNKRLLLIEGVSGEEFYSDAEDSGIHGNAIRGFLLSIILDFYTPIIFTKDCDDTAKFLLVLAKRKAKAHTSLRPSRDSMAITDRLQFILEGFPSIGPVTAKKLLSEFKTLKDIVNADEESLRRILGKRYERFKEIIDYYYNLLK